MSLDSLPTLTATVQAHNLRADKSLGQHFLLDMNLTDRIARLAQPLEGHHVAEIGPGPGGLTRALMVNGAASVTAIEMDARFLPALEMIQQADPRLTIIHGDALKVDLGEVITAPRIIAANLPYNVGTKLLIDWLRADWDWVRMVLMFQLEVAERICAAPGESAYGRLAVLCQSVATCRIALGVPARAFSPPPKVDSAVVVLEPLELPYADLKRLGEVTAAAFGQRRKMVRASLKGLAKQRGINVADWLAACEIDPTARPETLPVSAFQRLADALNHA